MATYKNPWCREGIDRPDFHTDAVPLEYAGCLIYRVSTAQWDVVKGGTCITQRTTLNGAKQAADIVADMLFPNYEDVHGRMLDRYGHL